MLLVYNVFVYLFTTIVTTTILFGTKNKLNKIVPLLSKIT
jgi:hypothetical protein